MVEAHGRRTMCEKMPCKTSGPPKINNIQGDKTLYNDCYQDQILSTAIKAAFLIQEVV
jgi:hypothetical protein